VTVKDKDGNDIKVTDNGDGTYSFVMPAGSVSVSASFTEKQHECPASKFGDVDLDAWYHQYLDYVLGKGIMEGVGGGRFAPQAATTRAMIVTMLHRLEGTPESGIEMPFDDVEEGLWYSEAVKWAAENGIVEGYGDGRFGPTDQITREQFVTIMHRYAQFKGIDVSVGEDTNILSYDDALDISDWAVSAMQWGVGSGLIEGRSYSLLVPQGNATRAEAATIFERFIEEIEK
ncbi:MAG: S-layer homology domain-containing protein, partial [Firmicutes bacterium]|nr:S-layer homology domain-containing protein [Bacillota bacterium]